MVDDLIGDQEERRREKIEHKRRKRALVERLTMPDRALRMHPTGLEYWRHCDWVSVHCMYLDYEMVGDDVDQQHCSSGYGDC
jgi:hypothetical protein